MLWPASWKKIDKASKIDLAISTHYILRPTYEAQAEEFYRAFDLAWDSGGWTIYIDELFYLQRLHLEPAIEKLLTQGRSNYITVMSGVQRPAWVTRFAMSEARHIMAGKMGDKADVKRVGEIVGQEYAGKVQALQFHDFLWLDRNTDEMRVITRDSVQKVFGGKEN